MSRGPNFIERDVFGEIMREVPRRDGTDYQDVDTVYGDMSRLVVAWLAHTPHDRLRELYNELGWGGSGNARAMHEAVKAWLAKYHPGRCPVVEVTTG